MEKIGRVRSYSLNLNQGYITFDDASDDVIIYQHTLQKNGLELLRVGQKVLTILEKKGSHTEIFAIEVITENNNEMTGNGHD